MIPANQQVNKLGKFLKKKLEAHKISFSSNTCDLYIMLYYQKPILPDRPGEMKYSDIMEMEFNISITTYSKAIRVNILEISPEEYTVGHVRVDEDELLDMESVKQKILNFIRKQISKRYENYEFIF